MAWMWDWAQRRLGRLAVQKTLGKFLRYKLDDEQVSVDSSGAFSLSQVELDAQVRWVCTAVAQRLFRDAAALRWPLGLRRGLTYLTRSTLALSPVGPGQVPQGHAAAGRLRVHSQSLWQRAHCGTLHLRTEFGRR